MFYLETLDPVPASSAAARRIVERFAADVDEEALRRLRLLVSELVTNAIEHVEDPTPVSLRVELSGARIRVEVSDQGPGFVARPRGPDAPLNSGWGLHFVERLAEAWGTETDGGTMVWFELPAQGAGVAA